MQNKLVKKFFSFSYGSVVGAVISFATTMIMTRLLVPEEFGKVSMFTLFVNIAMTFAMFGTDQTFVRYFYEEKENKRGALLYNCLKVAFIILIPILVLLIIFRVTFLNYLFNEYNAIIFLVLVLTVVIQILFRFSTLVVRMQQKGNIYSIMEILNKLIILISFLVFYSFIGGSYKVIIYSTFVSILLLLIFLMYSQRHYWKLKNYNVGGTLHTKYEILQYGYPLVFSSALMWVFRGFDQFAIKQWADFNELGLYAAAFKIIGLLTIMQATFSTFWVPVAYEAYQRDPSNTTFFGNVSKLISCMMMLVGVVVIIMKDTIIFLLGEDYQGAGSMIAFLILIPIMRTISETTVIGINFKKKVKWHIVIVSVSCIANVLGNWLLVPNYGGLGASISTGLSYILYFTLRTFISLKYYKVDYGLSKVYFSLIILILFSCYTLFTYPLLNEKVVGVVIFFIIILIYFKDIKRMFSQLKKG